jgi:hypothetical protein
LQLATSTSTAWILPNLYVTKLANFQKKIVSQVQLGATFAYFVGKSKEELPAICMISSTTS